MKKISTIAILLLCCHSIYCQIVNIPDTNFKTALLNYDPLIDLNSDGEIQVSEAASFTDDLILSNNSITDLTGIEAFVNLTHLAVRFNPISSIDLSSNTSLEFLNIFQNQLTSLDVSQNVNLRDLSCGQNNLTNFDLSSNALLEFLTISQVPLVSLNVTQNVNLNRIILQEVPLANLDVSGNPNLDFLYFTDTMISDVDLTSNINLTELNCQSNLLTQLDLSQNTNLVSVICSFQDIQSIDVSNSPNLEVLKMGYNSLLSLDLTQNPNILDLTCHFNNLTELDLSNQTALERLLCYDNPMTFLDVRSGQNELLVDFEAQNIPDLCIEVDNAADANSGVGVYASWLKDPTAFYSEDCNDLIVGIPDVNFKNALVNESVVVINGTGGLQDADTNNDGEIQLSEALAVTDMQVQDQNISSMVGLHSFTNLVKLLCFDNNLTEIDLSQNILLDELWVNQNNLSSLDVTMMTNLDWLSCSDNSLTALDVSQNPNLRIFRTSRNQISEIDVSNNLVLEQFWCSDNLVSALDISNNPIITTFSGKGNPNLTSLNLQNGNNNKMSRMWAQDNPLLDCILVDDEAASYPICDISGNTGWCKDSNAIYAEDSSSCSLGSRDYDNKRFEIFPNPAGKFVEILSSKRVLTIQIISISGQKVLMANQKRIDVSSLPDGLYIMTIKDSENQISYRKLIKSMK